VHKIREVLRLWLRGESLRSVERLSRVAEAVRQHRADGHGPAWALLAAHHDELKALLDDGLTVVKASELPARRGMVVPQWTLHWYALEVLGHGRAGAAPAAYPPQVHNRRRQARRSRGHSMARELASFVWAEITS
jgi:hypothetical protein